MEDQLSKWSWIFAFGTYGVYDTITTIQVSQYLGSFEYEKSEVLRIAMMNVGIEGFVFVKLLFSAIALGMALYLAECLEGWRWMGIGMMWGATLGGLYVGTSNMNIIWNGSSYWLLGFDSGTVSAAIIIIVAFGTAILGSSLFPHHNHPKKLE